jgi:hypothetical protein
METLNREQLILNRDLTVEENYTLFDYIFENKAVILSNRNNLSILLSGLTDSSDEFSYTSELLDLVRDFQAVLGTEVYITEIFRNIEYVLPQGSHWYLHLIMDIISFIEKEDIQSLEISINSINNTQKKMLEGILLYLKSESIYEMSENETLNRMLSFTVI